ncbi:unnamed protein product [Parnassius apollo]|uniref:(apollo) hypothetical protein n=1 Tax=Parnassius apollo TaxID=110799 RepID=A0A8S3XZV8_PARAO|nr:unnamed protein product [Parnassius apollo]
MLRHKYVARVQLLHKDLKRQQIDTSNYYNHLQKRIAVEKPVDFRMKTPEKVQVSSINPSSHGLLPDSSHGYSLRLSYLPRRDYATRCHIPAKRCSASFV